MTPEAVAARSAIESLRSGVPSRHAVTQLGTTQTEVKERFDTALEALTAGQGVEPIVVSANFGAGKSHLLNYLQALAAQQGFVNSFVVVSPEMPLGNGHAVLKTLAESAQAPGRTGTALHALTHDLRTNSPAYADLRLWAKEAGIHDRFRALLHIYEEFRADEELRTLVLEDFEGKPLLKNVIRQKLKELGELAAYDLSGPRNTLLAHDRIRLLAQFYRAAGGKGLVVLFDEVERIARFSIKQRIAAYQELGWWSDIARQEGSAILPIFTLASGFLLETVTGGTYDEQRFQSARIDADQDARDLMALRGIALLKTFHRLESLTPEQEEQVKYRVKHLYEQAYEITAPRLPRDRAVTTIRAEIRRWITLWDLHRYYPDYAPQLQEEALTFDSSEIADDALPTEEENEGFS